MSSCLWWVILPYTAVILGMTTLRSAWIALIGFHLALLPLILPQLRTFSTLRLAPVSWKVTLPVAFLGSLAGAGLWILWPYAGIPVDFPAQVAVLGLDDSTWLPFIAYFTLVNPILEELYWRSVLTSSSRYPAPVDFLFSGYHIFIVSLFVRWPFVLFTFFVITVAGWLWRRISSRAHSLFPAVLSHTMADLSILLVLYHFGS